MQRYVLDMKLRVTKTSSHQKKQENIGEMKCLADIMNLMKTNYEFWSGNLG